MPDIVKESYDMKKEDFIETPIHIQWFYDDLIEVFKRHNLSIAHEDYHGGFIIENYNDYNVKWLMDASLDID